MLSLAHVDAAGQQLESEFASVVNQLNFKDPLRDRRPTHLLSPTAVIAAQLDALQINDWPEQDAGVRTAYAFSKPHDCEQLLSSQVRRGWKLPDAGVSNLHMA
eukprot:jgi/Chrzof1/10570/Cz05g03250.t1